MKGYDRWFVLPAIFVLAFIILVESGMARPIQTSDSHIAGKGSSLGHLMASKVNFGMNSSQLYSVAYQNQSATYCIDSDGGLNYEVAGHVEGTGPSGWFYTYYDACQTGTYEGYLKETYCNGTLWWAKRYQCPDGCVNGACVSELCTDADGDGYAVEGGDCGAVDCNDANAGIHPGATEVCDNGVDDDCNGLIDDDDPACLVCTDSDGDGYAVEGGDCGAVDCNDADASIHPGVTEVCDNGVDDDCNGLIDDDDPACLVCTDSDGDGYAVEGGDCGAVDCNDANASIHPGATEVCDNGVDDDCNGLIDDDDPACLACTDSDGDGYAVEGGDCGVVDCNDADAGVHPGATEDCDNGVDDDCNGLIDDDDPACLACTDSDGDGYAVEGGECGAVDCNDANASIHPGAREVCDNGVDDDCDGDVDAEDADCDTSFKNIIVVGWDGTQRDHFWECYNKQLPDCPNGLPNIQALSDGVIFNSTITNGETSTKPGWAQIFTGYNTKVTGVYTNWQYKPIPEGYTVFEKAENHFGSNNVVTMFVSGKAEHTGGACVGEPTYKNGQLVIEDLGQPWCLTKTHLDYFETGLQFNSNVGNRALELLTAHQNDRIFALFMFWDPDVHGHMSGENSAYYSRQIVDDDSWLGKIVAKLRELGIYEQTLVYVVTDHGFDEGGNQHANAPYGMFASNDPLVIRSGDRKDIAPTLLERCGISRGAIGAAPAINGYSLYSIPSLACIPAGEAYLAYPGAPACCSGLQRISLDIRMGSSCIIATGGTGDNSGYCTACGNGVCEAPENKCNCPADCPY